MLRFYFIFKYFLKDQYWEKRGRRLASFQRPGLREWDDHLWYFRIVKTEMAAKPLATRPTPVQVPATDPTSTFKITFPFENSYSQ